MVGTVPLKTYSSSSSVIGKVVKDEVTSTFLARMLSKEAVGGVYMLPTILAMVTDIQKYLKDQKIEW